MFVWGMAEAISFPIMAEMSQVWLGLTHPERMWRRAAMVVAGSVTGVAVTHLLTRSGLQPPAPWTAPKMRAATSRYLSRGPRGYWKQALTGIPVKLFAAESGRSNLPLPSVVLHAAGERAARMTASTAIVKTLGKPLGLEGAIVGKALYNGNFTLQEALVVAGDEERREPSQARS